MKKKITVVFSLLLAMLVCLSFPVRAADQETEGDFTFTIEDNTATLRGYNGLGAEVTVPDTLGGYPVTTIATGVFSEKSWITRIELPSTLTRVEPGTFHPSQTVIYFADSDTPMEFNPDSINPDDLTDLSVGEEEENEIEDETQPSGNSGGANGNSQVGSNGSETVGSNNSGQLSQNGDGTEGVLPGDATPGADGDGENVDIGSNSSNNQGNKDQTSEKSGSLVLTVAILLVILAGAAVCLVILAKRKKE